MKYLRTRAARGEYMYKMYDVHSGVTYKKETTSTMYRVLVLVPGTGSISLRYIGSNEQCNKMIQCIWYEYLITKCGGSNNIEESINYHQK